MNSTASLLREAPPNIYNSGEYARHNPDWHERDAPWKAGKVHYILGKNGIRPMSICDIGCGTGGVLRTLGAFYPDAVLYGRDISPLALTMGGRDRIHRSLGSAEGAPKTDVALALDVAEHVEDYPAFLREMKGAARYTVYHFPLDINLMTLLRGKLVANRAELGHIHVFTAGTVLAALREAGHTIVDSVYTCGPADQPRSLKQRMAAAPRKAGLLAPRLAAQVLDGYSLLVLCH